MSKNIEINIKGSNGYEVLYPQTLSQNITDLNNYYYNKDQSLTSVTASLFGLGVDAIPDDVFKIINLKFVGVECITYVGTGQYGSDNVNSVTFKRKPFLIIVVQPYVYSNAVLLSGVGLFTTVFIEGTYRQYGYKLFDGSQDYNNVDVQKYHYAKIDGNTLYWYFNQTASVTIPYARQFNSSGVTYYTYGFSFLQE